MLHDPELLFLDEPTIGLDVNAKRNIRQFLRTLNEEFGKTILLTTHDMDDIEQLCSRVMVINHGQLTYDGTISSLRDTIGLPTMIRVAFRGQVQLPNTLPSAIQVTSMDDQVLTALVNRKEWRTMDILKELEQWGEIDDIEMKEPDFEDVIHNVY